jgi:hypothetical protein
VLILDQFLVTSVLRSIRTLGRFELFLDLLFVAILANFAEGLAEHPTGAQLVKYIVNFLLPTSTNSKRKILYNTAEDS